MRILIVDDETRLVRHVSKALRRAGHDPVAVSDGESAIARTAEASFDLIILDVGLPGIDGFEVLRRLRAQHAPTRVLMLTAHGELRDRIVGLQLGADDYLPKPFAMQELVARVEALSRRYMETPSFRLRVADLTFDVANSEVQRGGTPVELTSRELTLLGVLMRSPGRIFTRTELCERVWERENEAQTKLVDVFIGRLRKKLQEPPLIQTVPHVGYTITAL